MSRSVDIRIRNEIAELATVRDLLDRIGGELRVPAEALIRLQGALDEIVSNAIKYSWPDGSTGEILVRIMVRTSGVALEIVDDGIAFDPTGVPPPPPAARRPGPGGIGIHAVRHLVDNFAYQRIDGRNHTVLTTNCVVGEVPE
jgi:anti-sigma regulatory factor (Ser/Thr protein kinase)